MAPAQNSFGKYPPCPPPERVADSAWFAHLPFAFWVTGELKPSLLVELGTHTGVALCAFCQEIRRLGLECNAYGIDLWKGDPRRGLCGEKLREELSGYISSHYANFAYLIQSSFDDALPLFENGAIDLLHIAGQHGKEAMLHDFESWLPKMSKRGIVLLHDICARLPGYGGVEAWAGISAKYPSFAFNHGYGLGIVLAGEEAPQTLREMCALNPASGEADEIRGIFRRQGMIYEYIFARHAEREAELARQKAWKEQLVGELEKQRENAGLEKEKERAERESALRKEREEKEAYQKRLEEVLAENRMYRDKLSRRRETLLGRLGRFLRKEAF